MLSFAKVWDWWWQKANPASPTGVPELLYHCDICDSISCCLDLSCEGGRGPSLPPQGDQQLLQKLWTDGIGTTPFPFEKKMNQTWLLLIPQNIPVDFIFPGANEHRHLPAALRGLPLEIFFPIWSNQELYLTLMHEPLPSDRCRICSQTYS